MKPLGSVQAVVAAIREEAAAELEMLGQKTQAELDRIRAEEARDVVTVPDGESRLAAARQQARARLADQDWQDAREAFAERERWMARVVAQARQQLAEADTPDRRRTVLAALAREGLERLPAGPCDIVVSVGDATLLDSTWSQTLAATTGRANLRVIAGPVEGGCLARTLDGRASFDNSYAARAKRFESAWRAALAALYEGTVVPSVEPAEPHRR